MTGTPPGRWFLAAVGIAAFLNLSWSSVPFPYPEAAIFGFFVWIPLSLYWLVRLIKALTGGAGTPRATPARWLLAPFVVLCVWAAIHLDASFSARFALSRSGMEQYAKEVLAGGERTGLDCAWAGLYRVCRPDVIEDGGVPRGVRLNLVDWPFASTRCFVWMSEGRPRPESHEYGFRHLTGPWWGCKEWEGW
ncbi:hypothetical protein AB0F88_41720 [Streptosporangium sp. NPDC023963]|uniref:hypothetical protein n=1 Tax=Streptosporangium sp. NPDC023963 TaxID=3155608 RepID=UPI00342080E9